jgi:DNA-directed RNA polymerase specialized sigma subunit
MRIPLNMGNTKPTSKEEMARVMEHDILACKSGDWEAKARLIREFMPLLTSLAKKRAMENTLINQYIEAGKTGLVIATRKYKPSIGVNHFQIFALDFIEKQMNKANPKGGFFTRLFGLK